MNAGYPAIINDPTDYLRDELKNFKDITRYIKPLSGEIPEVPGIEIYGEIIPYNGIVGGDHIIYVDFKKRFDLDQRIQEAKKINRVDIAEKMELNKQRAGVLLADVSGHNLTDSILSAMLHQAFLTGVHYELSHNGEITPELFEILNNRFFQSSSVTKFITLIYGEIWSSGKFSFINAGHPAPIVFSFKFDKLIDICYDRVLHFPPIGTLPSRDDIDLRRHFSRLGYKKKYSVHEINLMGNGDILLLYTDGLTDHHQDEKNYYYPKFLGETLKRVKHASAQEIYFHLKEDLLNFSKPTDDIGIVVIKKI